MKHFFLSFDRSSSVTKLVQNSRLIYLFNEWMNEFIYFYRISRVLGHIFYFYLNTYGQNLENIALGGH